MSLDSARALRAFHDADNSQAVKMDRLTRGLLVCDNMEHQLNKGFLFTANASTIKDIGTSFDLRFASNLRRPRLVVRLNSSVKSTVEFWCNSVSTHNPLAEVPSFNMNRHSSASTSAISLCTSPGSAEVGSPDRTFHLGHHNNAKKIFAPGSMTEMWQLYSSTVFLIRFTSGADLSALNLTLLWSELPFYDVGDLMPGDIL